MALDALDELEKLLGCGAEWVLVGKPASRAFFNHRKYPVELTQERTVTYGYNEPWWEYHVFEKQENGVTVKVDKGRCPNFQHAKERSLRAIKILLLGDTKPTVP